MKKKILFPFLFITAISFAQKVDYNEIILPKQADSLVLNAMGLSPYEEKLVQLAWQNYPNSEIYTSRINIAEKRIHLECFNWTEDIKASFNFNQRNITQGLKTSERDSVYPNFYPWYNFSLGVNLGTFVKTPLRTGIAKEELDIAVATLNQQKLSLRAEVLKRYKNYQLKIELLKIRTQALEDSYSTHLLITRDFEKGAASLEEFINSAAAYNTATESKLIAETAVLEAKISLEEMIGVKLEEVGK